MTPARLQRRSHCVSEQCSILSANSTSFPNNFFTQLIDIKDCISQPRISNRSSVRTLRNLREMIIQGSVNSIFKHDVLALFGREFTRRDAANETAVTQ